MKKYRVEFIGTGLLVFTGGLAVVDPGAGAGSLIMRLEKAASRRIYFPGISGAAIADAAAFRFINSEGQ